MALSDPKPIIKVGDIVKRIAPYANGSYHWTPVMPVGATDEVVRVHGEGFGLDLKKWGEGHSADRFVVVSSPNIDTLIQEAEAELALLRARKEAMDEPKLGDIYKRDTTRAKVVYVGPQVVVLLEVVECKREWVATRANLKYNWSRC